MAQTSREIVRDCLMFASPKRIPRDMWLLPWAAQRYEQAVEQINKDFPGDFTGGPGVYQDSAVVKGSPYAKGQYTDEWGCVFTNVQEGIIGEVKTPLIQDIGDYRSVRPPYETLPLDWDKARDIVNRTCEDTDKFVMANC